MKQLSVEFRGKMDFIYVYQPHETTMDLYGVKNLPALLAVEPDGLHEFYSGGFGANKKVLYKKLQEFCQGVIGIPAFTGVDLSGFKTLPGFMQKCLAKDSGISFVALMGDKLKLTEENRGKLNLLNYLSREIEKQSKPYRVCWMDENITLLPEFSQKFKIKDSWMLLVNGKKGRFLAWNGPKTEKALQSLLQDLSQGQLAWSKITEEKEEL